MTRDPFRLGAYGVVTAPSPTGPRLLLVDKTSGPYAGRLDLPGGRVEVYEDPVDALVRELREECGLAVAPEDAALLAVRSVVFRYADPGGPSQLLHHVGVLWRVGLGEQRPVRAEPGEAEPEWVDLAAASSRHLTPFAWWAATHATGEGSGG